MGRETEEGGEEGGGRSTLAKRVMRPCCAAPRPCDSVQVIQTPEGGWWEGDMSGSHGWFPSYVQHLTPLLQAR